MQLLFGWVEFHGRFGFVRVGRWKLRWRRLLGWQSPLQLRWSARRLAQVSAHPWRDVLRLLLWPWPRRWPCAALPPPPRALFAAPDAVAARYYRDVHVQRQLPLWARRDTPQRAFFRLYEAVCAADDVLIGYATEYLFFRPGPAWALHCLPGPAAPETPPETPQETPQDQAERLAVLARVAVALADAFNWRLALGLRRDGSVAERAPDGTPAPWQPETPPPWAAAVPGLPAPLVLARGWNPLDLPPGCQPRYNIVIQGGALRTV